MSGRPGFVFVHVCAYASECLYLFMYVCVCLYVGVGLDLGSCAGRGQAGVYVDVTA